MDRILKQPMAIEVKQLEMFGLITIKVDLSKVEVQALFRKLAGSNLIEEREIIVGSGVSIAWMSPDEVLVICEYATIEKVRLEIVRHFKKIHCLIADMSDTRTFFQLAGDGWRDALAKGSPSDLSFRSFKEGMFMRSRLGNIAAAFWILDEQKVVVMCSRSVREFMYEWLKNACRAESQPMYEI